MRKFVWPLLLAAMLVHFYFIFAFPLNGDDVEHLHATYLIAHGKTPYVDFFEHHQPLWWYGLAPLFSAGMPVEAIIYLVRFAQLAFLALIGILTYRFFLLEGNKESDLSFLYIMLLSLTYYPIYNSSLSAKPDFLYFLIGFLGVYLMLLHLKKESRKFFIIGSLLIGVSVLLHAKALILLVLVGMISLFLLWKDLVKLLKFSIPFAVLAAAPNLLFIAWFYSGHGQGETVSYLNLVFFSVGEMMSAPYPHILDLAAGVFAYIPVFGLIILNRNRGPVFRGYLVTILFYMVLISYSEKAIVPFPTFIYVLPLLPFMAAYSAAGLAEIGERWRAGVILWVALMFLAGSAYLQFKERPTTIPISEISYFCNHYEGKTSFESYLCNEDVSYFWFSRQYNFRPLLVRIGKVSPEEPADVNEFVRYAKPFVLDGYVGRNYNGTEYVYEPNIDGYIRRE